MMELNKHLEGSKTEGKTAGIDSRSLSPTLDKELQRWKMPFGPLGGMANGFAVPLMILAGWSGQRVR